MKTFTFLILVAISSLYSVTSNAQELLSLRNAIDLALQNNFDVRIAERESKMAQNNVSIGNAGFLPTVGLNAIQNNSNNAVEQVFLDGRNLANPAARTRTLNANADLDWVVFDGLSMFHSYERLRELRQLGTINERIFKDNAISITSSAYYDVVRQMAQIRAFEDAVAISQARLDLARARYEVGTGSRLEYLSAQVDYNVDYSALLNQQQVFENSKITLNQIIGIDLNSGFVLSDSIIQLTDQYQLTQLIENAYSLNPALQQAQSFMRVANLDTRIVRAARYPVLILDAAYQYSQFTSDAGFLTSNRSRGYSYGFTARFNLFNGLNQRRLEQNALTMFQTSELRFESLKLAIEGDVLRAFNMYRNGLQRVALDQASLELARESTELALERYKIGVTTPLELREAQRNTTAAETRWIETLYNAKIAEINLLILSGNISR
jgi:outer membrane protein